MDSDGLEPATVGQARPDQGFIQPLIRMGTSQGAEVEPRLPGKKHSISVCVPKWETWRWFSKPSSLTAPDGECFAIRHTHPSELVYRASGLAVKTLSRRPPSFSNRSRRKSTIETCLYNSDFLSNIRRTSNKSSTLTVRTDFC